MDKKIIVVLIMVCLLIPLITADISLNPFADRKIIEKTPTEDMSEFLKDDFNYNYGVIRISKTFFWFETDKIAEYSLIENTANCLINCEARGKAILYSSMNLFDDIYFEDNFKREHKNNFKVFIKEDYNYTENRPLYSSTCEDKQTGNLNETKSTEECTNEISGYEDIIHYLERWNEYGGGVLPIGNYEWKIISKKEISYNIDFIPITKNIPLNEWAWWNNTWLKKKEITITENNGTTLYNYSITFNVTYDGDMNSNFSDLRFLNSAEDSELNYYIESQVDSIWAKVWVKIPTLIASSGTTIYMYYSSTGASSNSNISGTFLYADDFDVNTIADWNAVDITGSVYINTTYSKMTVDQDDPFPTYGRVGMVIGNQVINTSYIVEAKIDREEVGDGEENIGIQCFSPDLDFRYAFLSQTTSIGGGNMAWDMSIDAPSWAQHGRNTLTGGLLPDTYYVYGTHCIGNGTIKSVFQNSSGYEVPNSIIYTTSTDTTYVQGYASIKIVGIGEFHVDWFRTREFVKDIPTSVIGAEQSVVTMTITLNNPPINYTSNNQTVIFNCSAIDDIGVLNLTLILSGVDNYTEVGGVGQNLSIEKMYTIAESHFNWSCRGDNGITTITPLNRTVHIHTINPILTSNNITDIFVSTLPVNSTWNFSAVDEHLSICWYNTSENPTNVNVTCNNGLINDTIWNSEGIKNITFCANDTFENEDCKTELLRIGYYPYIHNASHSIIGEGDNVIFTLYVNGTGINPEFPTTNATLKYHGVDYSPDTIDRTNSDYTLFTKTLTISQGSGNSSGKLISYNWTYTIQNSSTSVFNEITDTKNITIFSMSLFDCVDGGDRVIFNTSLYDEELSDLVNITSPNIAIIEIDLTVESIINSSMTWDFSKKWEGNNTASICVPDGILNSSTYKIEITVGFDSTDHVREFYFLDNGTLDNTDYFNEYSPNVVNLMDLLIADSTTFLFEFTDKNDLEVPNSIIHTYRRYIGEGIFKEVERSRQDDEGQTHVHLVEEDVIYYFMITQYGNIIYTSTEYNAKCLSDPCELILTASETFIDFPLDWDIWNGTSYIIESEKTSRIVLLSFVSNHSVKVNLTIFEMDNGMISIINHSQTTATSGSISLTIPQSFGNQTFFASVFINNEFVRSNWIDLRQSAQDIFSTTGAILGALMFILIVLMAVSSGALIIVFAILGLIIIVLLQLIDMTWLALVSIICAGGIIIYKLIERRRR